MHGKGLKTLRRKVQCDFACSFLSSNQHLKTHSGEKSNKCNQCTFLILLDRQFEDAFEKTHSGDKWNQYKFVLLDSYSVIFGGPNIIRIRIRSFLEDQIIFVFVFGYFRRTEYYSYSYSVIFGRPNNIRIRIRSFSEDRILFILVFGHFWKTE